MDVAYRHRRGRTFLVPGTWKSGNPFTVNTTISAQLVGKDIVPITLVCTKTGERTFEMYFAAANQSGWPEMILSLDVKRTDTGVLANGDPFVDLLDSVTIEIVK